MVLDDPCLVGLVKYCKAQSITFKEYPQCLQAVKPVNPNLNRRKKIPPKSNDSVVSDHETSTSCSEGEDDIAYIKAIKASSRRVESKVFKANIPTEITNTTNTATSTANTTTQPVFNVSDSN